MQQCACHKHEDMILQKGLPCSQKEMFENCFPGHQGRQGYVMRTLSERSHGIVGKLKREELSGLLRSRNEDTVFQKPI
jgi:hypothetical protein